MTEEKIRKFVKELMEPVYDKLVDTVMAMYKDVFTKLPDSMTEDKKLETIKTIIKSQQAIINNGFESINVDDIKKQVEDLYGTATRP